MNVAALHIPDYPAWVRRWLVPSDRLVGVFADGRIISACAELRAQGVAVGDTVARAQALLPDAVLHEHDPHLDAAVWDDVLAVLFDVSPHLRPVRHGIATLAPFDLDALVALNRTLGGMLGLGRTPLVATLAAGHAEPGAVRTIAADEERGFFARASVRHLRAFEFEQEMIERLEMFGLVTVARVAALTCRHLTAQFGPSGRALFDLLHDHESAPPVPLYQPPPVISTSYAFEAPACEPRELIPALDALVTEAAERLGTLGAGMLTLRLDGGRGESTRTARRALKAATADARHLRTVATTLLGTLLRRRADVQTMTVRLGTLVERRGVQGALFDPRPALADVVRAVHRRFPGRLVRAAAVDLDAYLPEHATRFEPYPVLIPPLSSGPPRP